MMRLPMTISLRVSLSILTLVFANTSACALPPSELEGIHIRFSGTSPFLDDRMTEAVESGKAQCAQMQTLCAIPHVAADKPALCAGVAGGFKINGLLPGVQKRETNRYFATAQKMSAEYAKGLVLVPKSVCEYDVVEHESVKIVHRAPGGGGIRYELKNHPKKGRYWTRSDIPQLSPETFAMLEGTVPFADKSKVSPVSGRRMIAGYKCEVRDIAGPWLWTLCMAPTNTDFPGQVALAIKAVFGKDTLFESEATKIAMKSMLPSSLFFPPAGDRIEKTGAKSATNATQKWCLAQKAKTGVNPCTDGPDADD